MKVSHMGALSALSATALAASLGGLEVTLKPVDENDAEAVASAARAEAQRKSFEPPKGSTRICSVEEAMERTGTTTPSAALKEIKRIRGRSTGYMPHNGAKQKAKAEKRRIAELKKSVGL